MKLDTILRLLCFPCSVPLLNFSINLFSTSSRVTLELSEISFSSKIVSLLLPWRSSLFYNLDICFSNSSFVLDDFTSLLKLVSAIFYQVLIFSPNDIPLKTMKNVFHFIEKALFVLEIFKFLWFFPFLSTLSRFKTTNGSGINYDVMNWLA